MVLPKKQVFARVAIRKKEIVAKTAKKSPTIFYWLSLLSAAGIIVRLIGLLYKIPMTRILGDEGIGYYNTAYEIYNIGLILSSPNVTGAGLLGFSSIFGDMIRGGVKGFRLGGDPLLRSCELSGG